ncbi:MAG: hypothetical protein PHP45_03410 [Elusimicrobiales bacterium]|nr:hypothetical protein [Elusimicrobiales bacterium]
MKVAIASPWMDSRAAARYACLPGKWAHKTIERAARAGHINHGDNGLRPMFTREQVDQWLISNSHRKLRRGRGIGAAA